MKEKKINKKLVKKKEIADKNHLLFMIDSALMGILKNVHYVNDDLQMDIYQCLLYVMLEPV